MSTQEWLNHTANAMQAVVGAIHYSSDVTALDAAWRRFIEPRSPLETLLLRGLVIVAVGHILRSPVVSEFIADAPECFRASASGTPLAGLKKAADLFITARKPALFTVSERIRHYVDLHYGEPLTTKSVASACHVNPRAVNEAIREITGLTFRKYLMTKRQEAALELIRGGMKVEAAALAVGYRAKGTFYRNCRRSTGMSPVACVQT